MATLAPLPPLPAYDLTALSEIKKIKDVGDKYPAVNLIAALLRQIALNVNTAPHDVHTNAQILTRSNKVYEAIIQSMGTLDQAADSDTIDINQWDLFENYTTAIPILERILLDIPHATGSPDATRSYLPPDTSTREAVTHVHRWLAERAKLKLALESLKEDSLKKISPEASKALIAEYATHRVKDDNSIIKALSDFIKNDKLQEKDIIKQRGSAPSALADVKKLANEIAISIAQKPLSEEISCLVVRSLAVIYIPLAVISRQGTPLDWKAYLKKANVWLTLRELLVKVKQQIATPTGDLKAEFNEIESLLLNLGDITVNTAKEMLQLIKLSAYIPRPYSGRAASLVKAIYNVDQFSRQEKNKALRGHRNGLKQTMEVSHTQLTEVKDAPYDFQTFSLTSKEYQTRKESINTLFQTVQPHYDTFGIITEWSQHDAAFKKSVETDEKHIEDGQKALAKASL